jgi:hypothetical protein
MLDKIIAYVLLMCWETVYEMETIKNCHVSFTCKTCTISTDKILVFNLNLEGN